MPVEVGERELSICSTPRAINAELASIEWSVTHAGSIRTHAPMVEFYQNSPGRDGTFFGA
ncbi:hypothetical protein D3C84_384660 [compost metagenome]